MTSNRDFFVKTIINVYFIYEEYNNLLIYAIFVFEIY